MSKIEILNLDLPAVFKTEPKKALLHQAVVMYLANARQSNAHTKLRGEVQGGGRKPWKQKGTGRARAGSSRSPLWIGGGITFGPRSDANYSKSMPAKMKRLALAMALSAKATAGKITVITEANVAEPKTKLVADMVQSIAPQATSVLIITTQTNAEFFRATRNLSNVAVVTVNDLNTYDVLNFDQLVFTKDAIAAVDAKLSTPPAATATK
jgi:large subunit ribosomal protein L4